MFFVHRVANAVTMMYNEADELTVCHFIRPKEREKIRHGLEEYGGQDEHEDISAHVTVETEQRTREEVSVVGEGRVIIPSSSDRDDRPQTDEGGQAVSTPSVGGSPSRPA